MGRTSWDFMTLGQTALKCDPQVVAEREALSIQISRWSWSSNLEWTITIQRIAGPGGFYLESQRLGAASFRAVLSYIASSRTRLACRRPCLNHLSPRPRKKKKKAGEWE